MKKYIISAALALFVSGSALPVLAQTAGCPAGVSSVNVRAGETLWGYKNDAWPALFELNPNLAAPWRKFTTPAGGPGIKLAIGETVCGVTRNGEGVIVPQGTMELSTNSWAQVWDVVKKDGPWALLMFIAIGALLLVWLFNELRKHPVHSGPAIRSGGVNTLDEARERFNEVGMRYARSGESFQLRDIVAGRMNGELLVRYQDGTERPRTVTDLPAYRATAVFSDGRTEELYMLQACGNDLRFGGVLRYVPGMTFAFTPAQVEVAVAAPAIEVAPAAMHVPAAANEAAYEAEVPATERNVPTFACYGQYGDKPPMVTFDHTKVSVAIEGSMTTIRFIDNTTVGDSAPGHAPAERVAS